MTANIDFVSDCFERFNREIFNGELPPIEVKLSHARTFVGKVQYRYVRGAFGRIKGYRDYVMRISTLFDLPQEELEDVVIHEMIHYWILTRGIKDTSTHGTCFRARMADINSRYGRHITVSHKGAAAQPKAGKPKTHCVCVMRLRGQSKIGVTVCSEARIKWLQRRLPLAFPIEESRWFTSTDPWFNRFPHVRTVKLYLIDEAQLLPHVPDFQA